ncbi:hypothetical protein FOQG_04190 [Fusarium oxysporum f. sp. raphani 54005]|uniref:Uncharacterized protein n=2 Tax=Fusarium oxysporum f. sp. raphani TaxID=96318 RepID=X0CMI0_FUSOX|nr:hypothetical protein FOQG_04190 [Fusarium oxysporum f. sp. raphani 54005]KAG7433381.1 hypothetical protein Forpi1262_v006889 [Fusarium oxysporum f. sp. raphani]
MGAPPKALEEKKKKEDPHVEHLGDETGSQCVLCGKTSHNINTCLDLPEGELRACPLCHDTNHLVDLCASFTDMNIAEQVRVLVFERAGLLPLATHYSNKWWDFLGIWLLDDVSFGQKLPETFPWSQEATAERASRQHGKYIVELQTAFDNSGHNRDNLPKDESTYTMEAVYTKYLATQMEWPQLLVEMGAGTRPVQGATVNEGDSMETGEFSL